MIKEILLLGNEDLYKKSLPVAKEEMDAVKETVSDLHDTLIDFRKNITQEGQLQRRRLEYLKG